MNPFEITTEHIELCRLLKAAFPFISGGQAKQLIADGNVFVDGAIEYRKKCKIKPGQTVTLGDKEILITSP